MIPTAATRAVVIEREFPFPPDRLWRALTQPHLIEAWLMKNDFAPVVGHRFNLRFAVAFGYLMHQCRGARAALEIRHGLDHLGFVVSG